VVSCRESGAVVVLKSEEMEREIMRNKHKLKRGRVFVENDLSWEKRKTQEEINRWAKVQREKGIDVKIGIGRVKSSWRYWTEILKEKEKREVIGERRKREREGGEKEDVEDERSEKQGRIRVDKSRRAGGEEKEDGRGEIDGEKGMEKNFE